MLDTISQRYITLAFALEQHVEGFVDAYFTYFVVRQILGAWIARGDRRERFRRLLTEQAYPSMLT